MSLILQNFIADLSANPQALKILGVGSARLAELQTEAQLDTTRSWIKASPADQDHLDLADKIGVMVSGYRLVADAVPDGFDPDTNTLTIPLGRLHNAGDIYLPCERDCA